MAKEKATTVEDAAAEADPAPTATKPSLGVLVHDLGDGTNAVHGIEADGTEHQIVIPQNAGAMIAFKEMLTGWFTRLGERSTTWDKQVPVADTQPAVEQVPAEGTTGGS